MFNLLFIGIGGFIGAVARYLLSGLFYNILGDRFPYGTFAVNIIGCLLLGFFLTLTEGKFIISPQVRSFIVIGILGAFTTFSTFSYETFALLQSGLYSSAILNIFLSVIISLAAVWGGIILAKLF